jgi:thiamine monophosphate synthase
MLPEWVAGALVGPVFQPQSVYEPVQVLGVGKVVDKLIACGSTRDSSNSEQGTSAFKIPQVIAFGGIDHENLDEIKKLPVQGVSVLGGIWNYADPVNAFIKLSRAI